MSFNTPLDWSFVVMPLVVLLLGILIMFLGVGHFLARQSSRGFSHLLGGLPIALAGLVAALLVLNTQSYARLSYEKAVAEVQVAALDAGGGLYRVMVRRLDGPATTSDCVIRGDEWQLSARVQKWKAWATVLGLDTTYALDQLANKYATALRGNGKPIMACDLTPARPAINRFVPAPWLDFLIDHAYAEQRRFGSAVFMPLADGAVYRVTMTQSGLNAEAVNPIAQSAVRTWTGGATPR